MKQLASKKTEHPTFKLILIDCYSTPRLVIFKLCRGVLYNKIIYHSSDAVLEYAAFASLFICLSRVYTTFDPLSASHECILRLTLLSASHGCILRLPLPLFVSQEGILCLPFSLSASHCACLFH